MDRTEILRQYLALPAEQREAFLEQQCNGEDDLRQWLLEQTIQHEDVQNIDATSNRVDEESLNDEFQLQTLSFGKQSALDQSIALQPDEPDSLIAGSLIGPYKILDTLGEGGMGTVFLAEQKQPVARRVALKVIKAAGGAKEVLARFEAERQAMAMMNHPNIARILDAGATHDGQPYFAMELVQGKPITNYCDQNRLSIEDRLRLFCDVCAGVQHAHQKGIIHRDLKPSNILVAVVDGKAIAKVIDFGLAKAMESTQKLTDQTLFTGIGQVLGTLKYMSPEQAGLETLDIDTRTDIYALGIILYELLTGQTPLDSETIKGQAVLKVLEMIRDKEPVKPSSRLSNSDAESLSSVTQLRRTDLKRIQRELTGDLDWIVMKALEKDRTRRYDSASGFADDVQRYLTNEPVEARPPSLGYRMRKFVRKNRVGVSAFTVVMLALVGGIVGTSWGMFLAGQAEELAKNRLTELEIARENELKESLEKRLNLSIAAGQWVSGLEVVEDFLKLQPQRVDLHISQLRCLNALGRTGAVKRKLEQLNSDTKAGAIAIWHAEHLLDRNSSQFKTQIEDALRSKTLSDAENSYAQAIIEEDPVKVVSLLRNTLRIDPAHYRAFTFLFNTLLQTGRIADSETEISFVLDRFPRDPNLQMLKILCLEAQGKRDEALETKKRLLKENPALLTTQVEALAGSFRQWSTASFSTEDSNFDGILAVLRPLQFKRSSKIPLVSSPYQWNVEFIIEKKPAGLDEHRSKFAEIYGRLNMARVVGLANSKTYLAAAHELEAQLGPWSTGEDYFIIAQSYFLAGENRPAGMKFANAANMPFRYMRIKDDCRFHSAMSFATEWIDSNKLNKAAVEEYGIQVRHHLKVPPRIVWYEESLGKLAVHAGDLNAAREYRDRLKQIASAPESVMEVENRIGQMPSAIVEEHLNILIDRNSPADQLTGYKDEVIESIENAFKSAVNLQGSDE